MLQSAYTCFEGRRIIRTADEKKKTNVSNTAVNNAILKHNLFIAKERVDQEHERLEATISYGENLFVCLDNTVRK